MSLKSGTKKCSYCHSHDLANSRYRGIDNVLVFVFGYKPYRCLACYKRSWFLSSKTPHIGALSIFLVIFGLLSFGFINQSRPSQVISPVNASDTESELTTNQASPQTLELNSAVSTFTHKTNEGYEIKKLSPSYEHAKLVMDIQVSEASSNALMSDQSKVVEELQETDIVTNDENTVDVQTVKTVLNTTTPNEPKVAGNFQDTSIIEKAQNASADFVTTSSVKNETVIEATSQIKEDIIFSVKTWRDAWENGNLDVYFDSYSESFKPNSMSIEKWKAKRTKSLSKPISRQIIFSDTKVDLSSNNRSAKMVLVQEYKSEPYSDRVRKRIVLRREGQHWKIVRELVLEVLKQS